MFKGIVQRYKSNPTVYYALSVCATWAGIGSLMNGVVMTQTFGWVPSLIWVFGNVLACILFGFLALRIPKICDVFRTKAMRHVCGLMCVFQAWLSMNGTQAVFADTVAGQTTGTVVAYALAVLFLIILYRKGMMRNVLTDGFGWIIVYLLAVFVTVAAVFVSRGQFAHIGTGLQADTMKQGIWKGFLLLPGPFTYPYFFEIIDYNEKNEDGTRKINVQKSFTLGGVFFGIYMAIIFALAWVRFTPALNFVKAVLITIIGASTLSSSMYSIYISFGRKLGLAVNAALILLWNALMPLGVMGMWTLMASVRIYFVAAAIIAAFVWNYMEKKKGAIA